MGADVSARETLTRPPQGAAMASTYRAPAWLPGGHAQTIYASLCVSVPHVRARRERWDTPDGDFIDVDRLDGAANAPLLVFFHGLEGGSRSHYARAMFAAVERRGWRMALAHFRGCGGELNRLPRAYHSGDSAEIDWILRRLRAEAGSAPLLAVGISLGGNALLKWLGEQGDSARNIVRAAAAISAPVDLTAAGDALENGFNVLYTRNFLVTLKRKGAAKLARFPGLFDGRRVACSRTLREFDDVVTAPLHGFRDAADYWLRSSAKPWLRHICVPTLVLNALNDPFMPGVHLPGPDEVSPHVALEYPAAGGHVGFVNGRFPGRFDWLPQRILSFLSPEVTR
jgi:predicted alpha/beta-fold hydrolase